MIEHYASLENDYTLETLVAVYSSSVAAAKFAVPAIFVVC